MSPRLTRRQFLPLLAASTMVRPAAAGVPVDAGRVRALARGFNLPDLVPDTRASGNRPRALAILHSRGMSHVRLPVHAEHVMPRFAGPATIEAALDDLRRALDLLLGIGFAVTVDMHPGGISLGFTEAIRMPALRALLEGWQALAAQLRRFPPARIFAELLNEPPIHDARWRQDAAVLVQKLRLWLPETTLITGPAPYQRVEALAAWPTLPDRNLVYAFHYYDPMYFTHQGADWMAGSPYARLAGIPYPARAGDPRLKDALLGLRQRGEAALAGDIEGSLSTPWIAATIEGQFAHLAEWGRTNGAPVILNEFGALRSKAAPADRCRWLANVRKAAEANGFGWAHWDYDGGFGLMQDGKLDKETLAALLPS